MSGYIYFFGESDTLGVGSAFWSRKFSSLKPNMIVQVDKQPKPVKSSLMTNMANRSNKMNDKH